MSDSINFSDFLRQAQHKRLLAQHPLDRKYPPGSPGLFVFMTELGELKTEPNVPAVDKLTAFAKESGLWSGLQEQIFALRIERAALDVKKPTLYKWRAFEASATTISFGEWIQSRGYRRRESSSRLERVDPPAASPSSPTSL